MTLTRRGFLTGLASALAAPAIVRAELIMPVRSIIRPVPTIYKMAVWDELLDTGIYDHWIVRIDSMMAWMARGMPSMPMILNELERPVVYTGPRPKE